MEHCPTPETLRLYAADELPTDQAERVDEHLERCKSCEKQVEELERLATGILYKELRNLSALRESLIFRHADDKTHENDSKLNQLELPEFIGSYKIHRVLGLGGMGIVYEAEQPTLKRRVAIKVVKPKHRLDADMLARFQREVGEALAYIRDKMGDNIVAPSVVFAPAAPPPLPKTRKPITSAKPPAPVAAAPIIVPPQPVRITPPVEEIKPVVVDKPEKQEPKPLDPKDDPRNQPKSKRNWNKGTSGRISFDFSQDDGRFAFGEGEYMFETSWTARGQNDIYSYRHTPSLKGIALVPGIRNPKQIRKASALNYSSYYQIVKPGDLLVLRNQHDKYAVIGVTRVINKDLVPAPRSVLEFSYYILSDGDDFSKMEDATKAKKRR